MTRRALRCWATATTAAWDPRRGWAEADGTRRGMAVAAAPTLAVWTGVAAFAAEPGAAALLLLLLLPVFLVPMAYEAARVLRPYRSSRAATEARVRHSLAAVGTGLGLPTLLSLALLAAHVGVDRTPSAAVTVVPLCLGLIPLAAAAVTLPWGLAVALGRTTCSTRGAA